MAKVSAKGLKDYNHQGFLTSNSGANSSDSPLYPSQEDAYYIDAWSGIEVTDPNPAKLVKDIEEGVYNNVTFPTKTFLNDLKLKNLAGGQKQTKDLDKLAGQTEGEHFVFYLDGVPQHLQPKAREIIIRVLSHPDYITKKDQGGNRAAKWTVHKGLQSVLAWGIHRNQTNHLGNVIPDHFHVFRSIHCITDKNYGVRFDKDDTKPIPYVDARDPDKRFVNAAMSLARHDIRANVQAQINEALKAAGIEATIELGTLQDKIGAAEDIKSEKLNKEAEENNKPLADVAQEHINDESLDEEEISDSVRQYGNLSEETIDKLEGIVNKT
ncbi:hypothetical protein JK253_004749, partial [Escherichia coli]|nr:hypothetical protein [Escherichia coli]